MYVDYRRMDTIHIDCQILIHRNRHTHQPETNILIPSGITIVRAHQFHDIFDLISLQSILETNYFLGYAQNRTRK